MSSVTTSPFVLCCAVRYALGRQSYAVGEVVGALVANAGNLGGMAGPIRRDIIEWLEHVDGLDHPLDLIQQWRRALEAIS